VIPATETATGTSSLQGRAADATMQQAWHWALMMEQPSHSGRIPTQPQGKRQGGAHFGAALHVYAAETGLFCIGENIDNELAMGSHSLGSQCSVCLGSRTLQTCWIAKRSHTLDSSYLSRAAKAITRGVDGGIGAAKGTAENELALVDGIVVGSHIVVSHLDGCFWIVVWKERWWCLVSFAKSVL